MLNGVIFEPGYGSGKQGKERVFVTTDEMPSHAHRHDYSWEGDSSGDGSLGWGHVLTEKAATPSTSYRPKDGAYSGRNVPHENLPPAVAAFAWKRTA